MNEKYVKLEDFTKNLGPRYKEMNGMKTKHSGEEYRDDYLIPMLKDQKVDKFILDINNTQGSTSFWEEAFGGAVRAGFTRDKINSKIELISDDNELINDIQIFMKNAKPRKQG